MNNAWDIVQDFNEMAGYRIVKEKNNGLDLVIYDMQTGDEFEVPAEEWVDKIRVFYETEHMELTETFEEKVRAIRYIATLKNARDHIKEIRENS